MIGGCWWRMTLLVAVAGLPYETAFGAEQARLRTGLTLNVPVVCRVEAVSPADRFPVTLREFCNTPRGFRVFAVHDRSLGGRAVFSYGGRRTRASGSGRTEVFALESAANVVRMFNVTGVRMADQRAVTLEIVPN